MIKKILLALTLLCAPFAAFGQGAQLQPGQVWGNSTAAPRNARGENPSAIIDRAISSTRGSILFRGASAWAGAAPGPSGFPWVSNGPGADPTYQVLPLVGGGTGSGNAAGARTNLGLVIGTNVEAWDTDLDCLAGLSATGLLRRTGSGTCSGGTAVANSEIAAGAANTVKGSLNGTTTADISIPSCSAAGSYLKYTSGTGFTCGSNPTRVVSTAATDTITTADCNGFVQEGTGSTGLFQISLPAASGFSNGCVIYVNNGDTGRGKQMVGWPSDLSSILWPSQTAAVVNVNSTAWKTIENPGRWKIPGSTEFCVRQDGSATSDGLGNGTVAADCFPLIQQAVSTIGTQWDGGGYNACSIGIYNGGTNILTEAVAQTGQSIGCYLTYNIRGTVTWGSTTNCLNSGNNAIAIINWNLGFSPSFKCNTSNTAGNGQFYCHQSCIYDFNGGTAIWYPGGVTGLGTGGTKGTNDVFFYVDLQGSASYNAQVNLGNGVDTFNPKAFVMCETHCSQVTLSGTVASSALVTFQQALVLQIGSVITHNLSWPGNAVTNATTVKGGSVLVQGSTVPGPAATATSPGVICATKGC